MRFDQLAIGDYFRVHGGAMILMKIIPSYESSREVNHMAPSGKCYFLNGPQSVIKVTADTPIPSSEDIKKEK